MSVDEKRQVAVSEAGKTMPAYTNEDIDNALKVFILSANAELASQILEEEMNLKVSSYQLRDWSLKVFRSRYYELREELKDVLEEQVAGQAMERALNASEAERIFTEHAVAKIDKVDPNQLANAAARFAQARALAVKDARLLRDKPTEIHQTKTVRENILTLKRLGFIDGEAEELTALVSGTDGEHAA